MSGHYRRDFSKSLSKNINGGKHQHKYTKIIATIIKPALDKEDNKYIFSWIEFLIAIWQKTSYCSVDITTDILSKCYKAFKLYDKYCKLLRKKNIKNNSLSAKKISILVELLKISR